MAKYHINKHGVPAICKAKDGNCPLGGQTGNENHFDSQEEAQKAADKINGANHEILPEITTNEMVSGNYEGNYCQINKEANDNLKQNLNADNLKDVFDKSLEKGDIEFTSESQSISNTPTYTFARVSKVDNDTYRLTGSVEEYLQAEEDFDDEDEFEEYIQSEPDGVYEVDFTFSSNELKEIMTEYNQLDNEVNESETAAAVVYGMSNLMRNNIE